MNSNSFSKTLIKHVGLNVLLIINFLIISTFLNAQSNSSLVTKENIKTQFIDLECTYIVNTLDTNEYKLMLKIFNTKQDLFINNNTYFFISDDAIANQLSSVDYDLIFVKNDLNKIIEFLNQHSTNMQLNEISIKSINKFMLNSAREVEVRKDFESFMITDNKTFESIIKGHLTLNNKSIFFNHLPFK